MKRESKKVITTKQSRAHELVECNGMSYRDAADKMDLSVSTVYEHVKAYEKKKEDYQNIFREENKEYEPHYITNRQKRIYLDINNDKEYSDYEKGRVEENLKTIRGFWRDEFN